MAKSKILVVDDEPFNVDYLEQELDDLGYETVSAVNGQDALEKVKAESPDLILLDIMMPIMDGFAVLAHMKADAAMRDIPVIIISAMNDLESVVKGVKQGAEDYLPKPFEPVLLHARIEAGLAKKRFRDQEIEYLKQVEKLSDAAVAIEQNAYEEKMIQDVTQRSDALGELARVFRNMANEVRAREQRLKRQLQQLQLDIEENQKSKSETAMVYIPMDRRQAMAQNKSLPEYAKGAALFADVSGFTALTESLANELGLQRGAEEVIRHLNRVYSMLVDEVHRYGGSIISFSGDAITCWFDEINLNGNEYSSQPAERAAACAFAMQSGMKQFAKINTPAGTTISLLIKVAIASGPARRFLVGNTDHHQIDVLAGKTLALLASTEGQAQRNEVLIAADGLDSIEERFIVSEWRGGKEYAVLTGLMKDIVIPEPWKTLPADSIPEEKLRAWMHPNVFEKVRAGKSDLLSELRPAAALFVKFSGLDYDVEPDAGKKLDLYIQWVEKVIAPYDGALIQLIVGDKGSYLYIVFGAPISHHEDAAQAVSAAMDLADLPEALSFINDLQIGLTYGQMRAGAYGGPAHRTYGVIGDKTNLAARLMQADIAESANPKEKKRPLILCNDTIYKATYVQFRYETLDPIQVKGKSQPVAIYRPVEKIKDQKESAGDILGRTVERALTIDRLTPAEQMTLKTASVIGRIFTLDVLKAVYPDENEREMISKHLASLAEQDLIIKRSTELESYSFKDPLTHETAYTLMLFAQRRQLHRAIAETLEQTTTSPRAYAELAYHWQAADDLAKAVQYLEKAGEHAREMGDFEEASRYFNESLTLIK